MSHLVITLAYKYNPNISVDEIAETTKEATLSACTENPSNVFLLVAGSKCLLKNIPGRKRPHWEHFWSQGEHVFGEVVQKIGMNRFSPRAQPRINAFLLDFIPEEDDNYEDKKVDLEDTFWTERDLKQVTSLVLSLLLREKCANISDITFVLPSVSKHDLARKIILDAFQKQNFMKDACIHFS